MKTWVFYALLSMLFAGATAVVAKLGMKNVSADTALAVRTSVIFILVWIGMFSVGKLKEVNSLTTSDLLFLGLSGLTTMLSWLFYYRAIKDGDISVVSGIDKGSLVITIILSVILFREPITLKLLFGTSLIIIGTLILLFK